MACPQHISIWISELEGFMRRKEDAVIDELERSPYVLEATQITKEEDELGCFKPSFLTIGPLHFDPCNPAYDKGNALKMEALRFLMESANLGIAASDAPLWQLQDGQEWIGVFSGIVDTIARKEDEIRRCYREGDRRIPSFLVGRDFGRMILVDACFILVSLYIFQSKTVKELIKNNDEEWPCLHFLTRGAEDATLRMILRDMVILENQLPSWLLKEVAHMLHIPHFPSQDYFGGCQELLRLMLGTNNSLYLEGINSNCYEAIHLPYIVRGCIVDLLYQRQLERGPQSAQPQPQPLTRRIFGDFLDLLRDGFSLLRDGLSWLTTKIVYIVEICMNSWVNSWVMAQNLSLVIGLILVILMFPVIMIILMVMVILLIPSFIIAYFWPNPVLTSEGRLRPHQFLPYFPDEEEWNLVLRNVIALERCSPYIRKTVTNYIFLMGEILETQQDVEALKAIGPKTVNSEREVQRWKSLAASANVHGRPYADFDDLVSGIRRKLPSHKERSKLRLMWWTWKLWAVDLKKTYASSPWIALSTFAAIALLFMTGAQVVCLFISCNKP